MNVSLLDTPLMTLPTRSTLTATIDSKRALRELLEHIIMNTDIRYMFMGGRTIGAAEVIAMTAEVIAIDELMASTLRIGKTQMKMFERYHQNKRINKATFIVGRVMEGTHRKTYNYWSDIKGVCDVNGWPVSVKDVNCKVLLMDTKAGRIVVETSSNLTTNKQSEQFSIEINDGLYRFYSSQVFGLEVESRETDRMTERQQAFCEAYLACGDPTQAAIEAGYSEKCARPEAFRLLRKPQIVNYINLSGEIVESRSSKIMTAQERQETLSSIAFATMEDAGDRIKAIDILNKMNGLYIEKHFVAHVSDDSVVEEINKYLEEKYVQKHIDCDVIE